MAGLTIPFEGAAHKLYRENIYTTTPTLGTNTVDISPPGGKIKPYGYLRALMLEVVLASGSGGNFAADAPWNYFSNIIVTLPNGQELYGDPNWNGYHAYLAAKHSAWEHANDPATWPSYVSTSPNVTFNIPIVFEINSQYGWGCLPNTDDSAPYKLKLVQNTIANIWTTAPTTTPSPTLNVYMLCWTIPEPQNRLTGDRQIVAPVGLGTLNKWSRQFYSISGGAAQAIDLTRKGNIIRQLLFVGRTSAGARLANASFFPNPLALIWDGVPMKPSDKPSQIVDDWYRHAGGQAGSTPGTVDTGVLPITFTDQAGADRSSDGVGLGNANYIGTTQSSRLELSGTFGASASQLEVLTNDLVVTDLVGNPYATGYGGPYLAAPAQPIAVT